jgi:hypothetical protein
LANPSDIHGNRTLLRQLLGDLRKPLPKQAPRGGRQIGDFDWPGVEGNE